MLHGWITYVYGLNISLTAATRHRYSQNANIFSKRVSHHPIKIKINYCRSFLWNFTQMPSDGSHPESMQQGRWTWYISPCCQSSINIYCFIQVFVDGPHILQPVDLVGSSTSQFGASEASNSEPTLTPRAWWKTNEEGTQAFGLDVSLATLRDILKAGRYEVCSRRFPRVIW